MDNNIGGNIEHSKMLSVANNNKASVDAVFAVACRRRFLRAPFPDQPLTGKDGVLHKTPKITKVINYIAAKLFGRISNLQFRDPLARMSPMQFYWVEARTKAGGKQILGTGYEAAALRLKRVLGVTN